MLAMETHARMLLKYFGHLNHLDYQPRNRFPAGQLSKRMTRPALLSHDTANDVDVIQQWFVAVEQSQKSQSTMVENWQ